MLVVDASVAVQACLRFDGFDGLEEHGFVGPALLWSETSSALHQMLWRKEISADLAAIAVARLQAAPIRRRQPRRLLNEAWRVADQFGWAKTYDAEYVALAVIEECPLLTIDAKLHATASRVVPVVGPLDL